MEIQDTDRQFPFSLVEYLFPKFPCHHPEEPRSKELTEILHCETKPGLVEKYTTS